jgi:hypothetical protein
MGLQFASAEVNVAANCKSFGIQRIGHLGGPIVGMEPDLAEVMAEAPLKEGSIL